MTAAPALPAALQARIDALIQTYIEAPERSGQTLRSLADAVACATLEEAAATSVQEQDRAAVCLAACEGIPTEKLRDKSIAEYVTNEAYLTGMAPGADGFNIGISGLACQLLAASFAGQFRASGAVNFLQLNMQHSELGDFFVTLQRAQGKTPAQLKQEAEAARDEMRAERDQLLRALAECREACPPASNPGVANLLTEAVGNPLAVPGYVQAAIAELLAQAQRRKGEEQYRTLVPGRIIQPGDEEFLDGSWQPVSALIGYRVGELMQVRRKNPCWDGAAGAPE